MRLRDDLQPISRDELTDLIAVWEASVRATHAFLTDDDIAFFRPLVADGVFSLPHLLGVREHVNEQNPEAVAFYRSPGFEVVGRSPLDPSGKPFPILHMRSTGATSRGIYDI
jgi:putative acetyltransferase